MTHIRRRRTVPCQAKRPRAIKILAGSDPERQVEAAVPHLLAVDAHKVCRGDGVLEHDEDNGLLAVIGDRAVGGVVAQVGSEAARHRRGVQSPPLPLQEERPRFVTAPKQLMGVGVVSPGFDPRPSLSVPKVSASLAPTTREAIGSC